MTITGPSPGDDPRPEGTQSGVSFIAWEQATGGQRLQLLHLWHERLADDDALFPLSPDSPTRLTEPDVAADRAADPDGSEAHAVLAVDATAINRVLGGVCLEFSRARAIGTLTGLLTRDRKGEQRHALEAGLILAASDLAHRLAEEHRQDASLRSADASPHPCTKSASRPCPLVGVFASLPDPRQTTTRGGADDEWERMARLERCGVRVLQVERTRRAGRKQASECRLALSRAPHAGGRAALLVMLPRHGYSEDTSSFGPDVTRYVTAHCVPPGDDGGPWTAVHPCALRAERPALEIERFSIALHYVSTPASLLPAASTATRARRAGASASGPRGRVRNADAASDRRSADDLASVFDSFERDILSYAYRDTRPFQSATDASQPPGGHAVTVHLPDELAFTSEGQRTVLWCAATDEASEDDRPGRELPLRVLRNRTVFPESGIEVLHLTLTPDPDAAGFVFNEYDLIKIAKLCEGGEGFQSELVEFHTQSAGGPGDACPSHEQPCHVVEYHDFFHQERGGSFGDFPHGCDDRRYCEPRAATIQVMTGRTRHAEQWVDVNHHLNLLAEDRPGALEHLRSHLLGQSGEPFPASSDRLVALGGVLQSLLDFERIDAWELGDVLQPIDHSDGYLLYLHKGVLLNVAESDRAAEVESNRAYVGINPYLLDAHTVLLHNEQVLRLARAEVRSLLAAEPPHERDDRRLARLQRAYRSLDTALFNDFLPNVFHYPTEQTIYEQGHQELGLLVEREALARQFEHVGRTVEAADAKLVGSAQVRLAVVALFVGLFAAWQVVQPLADYGQQAFVRLTSGTDAGHEIARIKPVLDVAGPTPGAPAPAPSDDAALSAPPADATVREQSPAPATPSSELRVESVQQFEVIPLLLFVLVCVVCVALILPSLRRR
jgi:hypothetical protein